MTGEVRDGDVRWPVGMDSASDPTTLPQGSYRFGVNILNREGIPKTRPGYRLTATLPAGRLQGFTFFHLRIGKPIAVVVVDGQIYRAQSPYNTFVAVEGDQMDPKAEKVYFQVATKAVQRNPDGSLKLLNPPQRLLMIQDGLSPATYYDGTKTRALTGDTATPQGTHMAWDGARLWVARRNLLFACDIADPLSAVEQTVNTLGGVGYFILPGTITGLALVPGVNLPPLLCFTQTTTSLFQSQIRDRSTWLATPSFQQTFLSKIGCSSERSIVEKNGMLWWWSSFGMTRLDFAQFSDVTSKIRLMDNELLVSKSNLSSDLSGIACASYENFMLTSVPHAGFKNSHTWVLDEGIQDRLTSEYPPAWSSLWTGINPVQYAKLSVKGVTRLFVASTDDDDSNKVYELFTSDRNDNGVDFPWRFESRGYTGGTAGYKHIRFAGYKLSELEGQVDIKVSWAGVSRGRWKTFANLSFNAHRGNIEASKQYSNEVPFYALKPQSRAGRTQDVRDLQPDDLASDGIEGFTSATESEKEVIDTAFQVLVEGAGPAAIRELILFMDAAAEPVSGQPDKAETDNNFVRYDGAASDEVADLDAAVEIFSADGEGEARYKNYVTHATASATSTVSQVAAQKIADQIAQARAEFALMEEVPPFSP